MFFSIKKFTSLALLSSLSSSSTPLLSEELGSVDYQFNLFGNDKTIIEVFDDPDFPSVACYLSRNQKGGVSGSLGLATDTSDASISCRLMSTPPPSLPPAVKSPTSVTVFKDSTSLLFKSLRVVRFYDKKRNVLVYLSYSTKLIEGSPKNSISVVPLFGAK